jgi:hypothetical protein
LLIWVKTIASAPDFFRRFPHPHKPTQQPEDAVAGVITRNTTIGQVLNFFH